MRNIKLSELTPDNLNANKGTQRGTGMLEKSLRDYGAGRSILVDKSGRIIAGNKTVEAAGSIGLDEAIIVETDGSKVVIVKRTDLSLDSVEARGLAIADNRVSEVGLEWDLEALDKIGEELDLSQFWFDGELPTLDLNSMEDAEFPDMLEGPGVHSRTFAFNDSQIEIVEKAISATGIASKSDAIALICEEFFKDG